MFEKKTEFEGWDVEHLAAIRRHEPVQQRQVKLAQHVVDCHAEIDRLNGELTAAKKHEEVFLIAIRKMTNEVDAHKWKRLRGLDDAARRFQRYCNLIRTLRASNAEQLREVHALRKSYQRSIIAMDAGSATIDRLNAELTALRAQVPAEREWISSETHEAFPEAGIYYWEGPGFRGVGLKGTFNVLNAGVHYTLILAEKDFPVPTKPEPQIEVKVGKYDIPGKGVGRVVWIDGDSCWFINPAGGHQAVVFVDALKELFEANNAVFIGEGDNQ